MHELSEGAAVRRLGALRGSRSIGEPARVESSQSTPCAACIVIACSVPYSASAVIANGHHAVVLSRSQAERRHLRAIIIAPRADTRPDSAR